MWPQASTEGKYPKKDAEFEVMEYFAMEGYVKPKAKEAHAASERLRGREDRALNLEEAAKALRDKFKKGCSNVANISGPQPDVQFCPKCGRKLRNVSRNEMRSRVTSRANTVPEHTHAYECTADGCKTRFEINQHRDL